MTIELNANEIGEAKTKPRRKEYREKQRQQLFEKIEHNKEGKGVVVIPPPVQRNNVIAGCTKQRVAAYVRVSTAEEQQLESFDMQVLHFKQRIENNPNYELTDIYKDEGISGTSVHKRLEFQRMIADAKAGKIDLILTKSISRFGRNIVDILDNLRLLSSLPNPVSVEFEMEGITYAGDSKNNLFIAILSALAEMESQQKSESVKTGIRWRMAEGVYRFSLYKTLGYRRDILGRIEIVQKEAKLIENIYDSFINGATLSTIARTLTNQGVKSPSGLDHWNSTTISYILKNEKYCGDALMQKTYTKDFRTHKAVKNMDMNKYFKENHHPAIIDREKWNLAQELLNARHHSKIVMSHSHNPTHISVQRVNKGKFKGFFFLEPHWSPDERQQFLTIMDDIQNKQKGENNNEV